MGKMGPLFSGHGNGYNNTIESKLTPKGKAFFNRITDRMQEDIDKALKNDKILIKDKISDLDFHFCLFCSQIALKQYVKLVKIDEGYYGCPECKFTKVTQEVYDRHFKNNNDNNPKEDEIIVPETNQTLEKKEKDKKLKERILEVIKSGPATIENIHEETGIDAGSIRAIINRDLKNKYIKETGEYKNKFKVYDLIAETEAKQERNRILKDLKKGFKSYTIFFEEISKRIGNNKTIKLEEYKDLLVQYIDREFIKSLNKKLQEEQ